jgi:hypothetical protein
VTRKRAGPMARSGHCSKDNFICLLGWDTLEVDYIRGFSLGITGMRFDSMLSH